MPPEDKEPSSDRKQTDESLRVEREKADRVLAEHLAAIDETADAVISRTRARADEVLAVARAKTDVRSASASPDEPPTRAVERERDQEDRAVREERESADKTVRDERAEHIARISSERDETDKDLLSERARSDDAIATRDEFLGIVSHDLRNMLNGMVGFAALIAQEVSREDHTEQVLKHAQRIQRSGARMNRLIGDLIDVAIIEGGGLAMMREAGDPAHVVSEAVDTFHAQASASGISLSAEIAPSPPMAEFDPARILQVLINLLSNAIKFTATGGTVVAHLGYSDEEILFTIRDTGPGIAADKLEAIFERFVQINQNDRRGVGLGLYISRCIVEGHGGRIWAESTLGKGSNFCFTLPRFISDRAP